MNSSQQIKVGAITAYVVVLFNIIAGLLYTPWMVNKIGKVDYGLYILITTFIAYFISDYGMWQAINKIISEYRANRQEENVKNLLGVATKLYLGMDVVVFIFVFSIYFYIGDIFVSLNSQELITFKSVFIVSATFGVLLFPLGLLRGVMMSYEFFFQIRVFDLINKIGLIIITIVLLYLDFGILSLVLAYGIVPLAIGIGKIVYLYKKNIKLNLKYWDIKVAKSIFSVSIWLLIVVIAELLINKISPSLIAALSGANEIAVFAIGFSISNYVYSIAGAINGIFIPKISRMQASNQNKEISDLTIKIGRIQQLVIGYTIFGIFLTGQSFIDAWIGHDLADSYYVMSLLILPGYITYSQQIESTKLFTANKIKYQSLMMIASAISSIILSLILIPKYGAIGAALSICIANIIFMVIGMNYFYHKSLEFNTQRFVKMILKFLLAYLFISLLYYLIKYSWIDSLLKNKGAWVYFITNGIIYSSLYSICMYLLIIDTYEKNLLKSVMKNILNRIK